MLSYEINNTLDRKYASSAFTIVELLIVIVVIAILAAISVVAYTGVQGRASDTAVQSDIRNLASAVMAYEAELGTLPVGLGNDNPHSFSGIKFRATRTAYQQGINNLYYCTISSGPGAKFGIAATSKSGKRFAYYNGSLQSFSGAWSSNTTICPAMGIAVSDPNFSFAWGQTTVNAWNGWIE